MLGEKSSTVSDQSVCAFLFGGLIIPGAGEGDLHGNIGNYRANTEEPGGVTGDNFCIGVCTDVAELHIAVFIVVCIGENAVVDHFLELEAGSNTGEVTAFVDGSKCIVEVIEIYDLSLIAGSMQELHIGVFFCSADHVVLMAEAVGKNDVAAVIGEVAGNFVAVFAFGNAGLYNELSAHFCAGFRCGNDEVVIIGGIFVMQCDEADLDGISGCIKSTERNDHNHNQEQRDDLFHVLRNPFL